VRRNSLTAPDSSKPHRSTPYFVDILQATVYDFYHTSPEGFKFSAKLPRITTH